MRWTSATPTRCGSISHKASSLRLAKGTFYLCTSKFVNGPDGKVWKHDGAAWFDLHAPAPGNYFNQSNWFATFFIGDLCFLTATSHGAWYARAAEVDQATAQTPPPWAEYPALNHLRIQRLHQTPDATLYLTTFGGGVWRVRRRCSFVMNRSTFSQQAVSAGGSPFGDSFYLVFDGVAPQELGITDHATGIAAAPTIVLRDDVGTVIPSAQAQATATSYLPENAQRATTVRQRFTFLYQVAFPSAAVFAGIASGGQRRITVTATKGIFVCTGEIRLVVAGAPYMLDGPTPWLSDDLRVFTVEAGTSRFGYSIPASATQDDVRTYIANVLRGPSSTLRSDFGALPTDYSGSALQWAEQRNGVPVFNFAVARVRYRAPVGAGAVNVQAFFRLCTTALTGLDYNPDTAYRSTPGSPAIALMGYQGNAISTVPCFAAKRETLPGGTGKMVDQTDPANVLTISGTGNEVIEYFGCWLDFNQEHNPQANKNNAQFENPWTSSPDGPFAGAKLSFQQIIRNNHQCLVAQLYQNPDPNVRGDTPSGSDKLAQRNLLIVGSDNPGSRDTHTVQQTFEISAQGRVGVGLAAHATGADAGDEADGEDIHDELIFRWGGLPRQTRVTLFSPTLDVDTALELASAGDGPDMLRRVDRHTLECVVGEMTFVPVPPGSVTNIPVLLTLELPDTVRYDETFRVLIQQSAGLPRRIVGTIEIVVPVRHPKALLPDEERKLAVLRHVSRTIPPADRWAPVVARYIEQVAARVTGFGGDPDRIPASGVGSPRDHRKGCLPRTAGALLRFVRRVRG
jgi:hypothetical protein